VLANHPHPLPPYCIAVPNNDLDKAAREWSTGRDSDPAALRTLKTIAACGFFAKPEGKPHLYYFWKVDSTAVPTKEVQRLASFLHTFGWGVDMAYADSFILDDREKQQLTAQRGYSHYVVADKGELCDVPAPGYLQDLTDAYERYCNRISEKGIDPATRATNYAQRYYQQAGKSRPPLARFLLRQLNNGDSSYAVPWSLGMRVAAWIRHAAAEALEQEGYDKDFVNSYVLGHGEDGHARHMSFIPVPTIRTIHGDGPVRRVMLVEPLDADGRITELLQWKLVPSVLYQLVGNVSGPRRTAPVCSLAESQDDGVWSNYLPDDNNCFWQSVTPVILHGYNYLRGKLSVRKTERLLGQAFQNAGYARNSIAEVFFQSAPLWHGTEGAMAMRVPQHLSKFPRYHVAVRFHEPVAGPVLAGLGRHYGIGLFGVRK
jgi:CRISPR-associated protein Csb2